MCRECARLSAQRYRARKVETKVSISARCSLTIREPLPPFALPKVKVAEGTRAQRALDLDAGGMVRGGEAQGC